VRSNEICVTGCGNKMATLPVCLGEFFMFLFMISVNLFSLFIANIASFSIYIVANTNYMLYLF